MKILIKTLCYLISILPIMTAMAADTATDGAGSEMDEQTAVIIGASYAQSWDIGQIGPLSVINAGIDGQQSYELLERFQRDVIDRSPRMVIIWGYINDIHRNPRDDIDKTVQRAKDSFAEMVQLARTNGITPVVATEVTIRPPEGWKETVMGWIGALRGKSSYQDYVNQHVQELNAWLRDYAGREGLVLLDFESQLSDADGQRQAKFATPDGTHITPAAYEKLTEYTLKHIR